MWPELHALTERVKQLKQTNREDRIVRIHPLINGHVYPERTKNQDGITYKQASQLFLNNGNGVFAIANEKVSGVLNNKMVVRGVALGDYDKDGDLDLLLTENNGPAHLWRNDTENLKDLSRKSSEFGKL